MVTFNLLPWRKYQYGLQRSKLIRHAIYSIGGALVLQAIWHSVLIMQTTEQTKTLKTLRIKAEQMDSQLAVHSHPSAINSKPDIHDRLQLYSLLRAINSMHHFDLCLTSINYKRNHLTLVGNAYSYFDLQQFLNVYQKEEHYKQLKIESLKFNKQQQINFKLINTIE